MQNYHSITIKVLGPTNTRGSRVKLTSTRFSCSVTLNRDYSTSSLLDQAKTWLVEHGYEVVGICEDGRDERLLLTTTFKDFKEA